MVDTTVEPVKEFWLRIVVKKIFRPWDRYIAKKNMDEFNRLVTYWETKDCPNTSEFMKQEEDKWRIRYIELGGIIR